MEISSEVDKELAKLRKQGVAKNIDPKELSGEVKLNIDLQFRKIEPFIEKVCGLK